MDHEVYGSENTVLRNSCLLCVLALVLQYKHIMLPVSPGCPCWHNPLVWHRQQCVAEIRIRNTECTWTHFSRSLNDPLIYFFIVTQHSPVQIMKKINRFQNVRNNVTRKVYRFIIYSRSNHWQRMVLPFFYPPSKRPIFLYILYILFGINLEYVLG